MSIPPRHQFRLARRHAGADRCCDSNLPCRPGNRSAPFNEPSRVTESSCVLALPPGHPCHCGGRRRPPSTYPRCRGGPATRFPSTAATPGLGTASLFHASLVGGSAPLERSAAAARSVEGASRSVGSEPGARRGCGGGGRPSLRLRRPSGLTYGKYAQGPSGLLQAQIWASRARLAPSWPATTLRLRRKQEPARRGAQARVTKRSPITRRSMPVSVKQETASFGVQTMGSFSLNDVLRTSATPEIFRNSSMSPQ